MNLSSQDYILMLLSSFCFITWYWQFPFKRNHTIVCSLCAWMGFLQVLQHTLQKHIKFSLVYCRVPVAIYMVEYIINVYFQRTPVTTLQTSNDLKHPAAPQVMEIVQLPVWRASCYRQPDSPKRKQGWFISIPALPIAVYMALNECPIYSSAGSLKASCFNPLPSCAG